MCNCSHVFHRANSGPRHISCQIYIYLLYNICKAVWIMIQNHSKNGRMGTGHQLGRLLDEKTCKVHVIDLKKKTESKPKANKFIG